MLKNKHRCVALLPMKANSNRVKGKNFRNFLGKPLYRWMLDTLLAVDTIEKIVINTDAREILAKNGFIESEKIIIRDRRTELCGDDVSMNKIICDDIDCIKSDYYIMTHTTNPLLGLNTIYDALSIFNNQVLGLKKFDSLFSVNRYQSRFYSQNFSPINHNPANLIPTQNLPYIFEENSNLYLFTKDSFDKANARIGLNPILYATPFFESVDIDTEEDWGFAELCAKHLFNKNENEKDK